MLIFAKDLIGPCKANPRPLRPIIFALKYLILSYVWFKSMYLMEKVNEIGVKGKYWDYLGFNMVLSLKYKI